MRAQKRFFQKRKQKIFDKEFFDVKKLQRLKNLKKTMKIEKILFSIDFVEILFDFEIFDLNILF